jgi:polar amino acid transport system substrate-binding protein
MTTMRWYGVLLLTSLLPLSAEAAPFNQEGMAGQGMTVSICDDDNEWPPYSYFQRKDGVKTEKLGGYAIDVIEDIFARHRIRYDIKLIPWPRCVAVSTLGTDYHMVLNMSYSPERVKNYLFSRAYYSTTTYYYYSKHNHPKGLAIAGPADLRKHRVCGVQGFNYTSYGFVPGEIDQGAKDFSALIAKVKLGRCALFVEKDEVMSAYSKIGKPYLADPDLAKAPVPGMKPTRFYFGISRKFAHSIELLDLIDSELLLMEENGRLAALWKKASAQVQAH